MVARRCSWIASGLAAALVIGLTLAGSAARAEDEKDKLDLDKIPKAVMDALKGKFPNAKIHKWTKAKEGKDLVYDIEFKQDGRKCEADIKENGTYINYEKEIAIKDLPKAVRKAVDTKYPMANLTEAMEITAVEGKKEKLEGYEILLTTADKKEVEVTVAPDGKIVEDSGAKKEEKK